MRPKILSLLGVFWLLTLASAFGQQPEAPPAGAVPAAQQSDIECSGFISATPVPNAIYVFDGADNDFRAPFRSYSAGDFVYLRNRAGGNLAAGNEFAVVRPANQQMEVHWYDYQAASMRSLGRPYEDIGKVKVVNVTPQAAIAQVTFACSPIFLGDLAYARPVRAIPQYTPAAGLDRFALPNQKRLGAITAGVNNLAYLGQGLMAHVNLGTGDGARPGQKYRIFHIVRETMMEGYREIPLPPRETIGEMVILFCEEKSSVGMIVKSLREVELGDGIEEE